MNYTQYGCLIACLLIWRISYEANASELNTQVVEVTANDDFAQLYENESSVINVLHNDFGLYVGVQSLEIIQEPKNGVATVLDDHTLQYEPDLSFFGDDILIYKVCNTDGSCDEAHVRIRVNDVDFKPIAVNDSVEYIHGTELSIPILLNDTIKGDFPISVQIVEDFHHADAFIDEDNNLVPTFNRAFGGMDSLQYEICDADMDCSKAWVFVSVVHDGNTDFYIPNGFSPNGDGLNDTFYIPDFNNYDKIKLNVFSEWGVLVFQDDDYQNNWNGQANVGQMNGKILDSGTYYYVFSIVGLDKALTGYIYLSR